MATKKQARAGIKGGDITKLKLKSNQIVVFGSDREELQERVDKLPPRFDIVKFGTFRKPVKHIALATDRK